MSEGQLKSLNIPETIIFENGWPKAWFKHHGPQKHQENRLEKIPSNEISMSAIVSSLLQQAEGDIVAEHCYGHYDEEVNHFVVSVEYLTKEDLQHYAVTRGRGQVRSILQHFVYPKTKENNLIQCVWSSHGILTSVRRNVRNIYQRTSPAYDRCVTFDGPQHFSQSGFLTPYINDKLREACNEFANRLNYVSKRKLSGLLAFLKIGQDNSIYLIRCTTFRCSKEGPFASKPVDINVVFCQPPKPRCIIHTHVNVPRNRSRMQQLGIRTLSSAVDHGVHSLDVASVQTGDLEPLQNHLHDLYCDVSRFSITPKPPIMARRKKEEVGTSSSAAEATRSCAPMEAPTIHFPARPTIQRTFQSCDEYSHFRNALREFLIDIFYRDYWSKTESRGTTSFEFRLPPSLVVHMSPENLREGLARLGLTCPSDKVDSVFSFAGSMKNIPTEEFIHDAVMTFFPPPKKNDTVKEVSPKSPKSPTLRLVKAYKVSRIINEFSHSVSKTLSNPPAPNLRQLTDDVVDSDKEDDTKAGDESGAAQWLQLSAKRRSSQLALDVAGTTKAMQPHPEAGDITDTKKKPGAQEIEAKPPSSSSPKVKKIEPRKNRWKLQSSFPLLLPVEPQTARSSCGTTRRGMGREKASCPWDRALHAPTSPPPLVQQHDPFAPEMEYWLQ